MSTPQPTSELEDDDALLQMPIGIAAAAEAFIEGPAYTPPVDTLTGTPLGTYGDMLLVELNGFEGPLDLLLKLAREQKVDLAQISILALADQYLAYIHRAQKLRLEVAADYLVMAAWMAYLKSRLLLPRDNTTEEQNPAEMAALLAFQLLRLEAMQKAGAALLALPQLGTHFFRRGQASRIAEQEARRAANENADKSHIAWNVSLYELLSAMSEPLKRQQEASVYQVKATALFSTEAAYSRLSQMLGVMPEWSALQSFMPIVSEMDDDEDGDKANLSRRSAMAATFVASLEMAKNGLLEIRQEKTYGNIFLRRRETPQEPFVQSEV